MERDRLTDLIGKDKLKEAIEQLISENSGEKKLKTVQLLRGRQAELTRQNIQGVISYRIFPEFNHK